MSLTNKSESDYLVAFNTILACETMKLFKDDNNLKKKCFDLLAIKFKDNNTIIDPINIYRMKYRKNSEIFNFPKATEAKEQLNLFYIDSNKPLKENINNLIAVVENNYNLIKRRKKLYNYENYLLSYY